MNSDECRLPLVQGAENKWWLSAQLWATRLYPPLLGLENTEEEGSGRI